MIDRLGRGHSAVRSVLVAARTGGFNIWQALDSRARTNGRAASLAVELRQAENPTTY
jgi:hypothetical protein